MYKALENANAINDIARSKMIYVANILYGVDVV